MWRCGWKWDKGSVKHFDFRNFIHLLVDLYRQNRTKLHWVLNMSEWKIIFDFFSLLYWLVKPVRSGLHKEIVQDTQGGLETKLSVWNWTENGWNTRLCGLNGETWLYGETWYGNFLDIEHRGGRNALQTVQPRRKRRDWTIIWREWKGRLKHSIGTFNGQKMEVEAVSSVNDITRWEIAPVVPMTRKDQM